jgi:hypothetical protein
VPQRQRASVVEQRHDRERGAADQVVGQQHGAAVEPVKDAAGDQPAHRDRGGVGDDEPAQLPR